MRLIFLHQAPYSKRDYVRFGVETLRARGFEVETWDLSRVIHPGGAGSVRTAEPPDWRGHRVFASSAEACAALNELPPRSWAILLFGYSLRSLPVFRALSRSGVRYAVFMANLLPPLARKDWQSLSGLAKITPRRLLEKVFSFLSPALLGVRPANLALAGGEKSLRRWPVLGPETRTVWAHALDYDIFLASGAKKAGETDPIGVFLDEYLPFHPDYLLWGILPPMRPEEYYKGLRRVFSLAEKSLGIEVVIAAHPRSDYDAHPGLFGGRKVIRGETIDLIRRSRLVFAHASTSINFAVLFSKPIAFLTARKLREDLVGGQTSVISGLLGKRPVDMDDPGSVDWAGESRADAAAYAAYRNDYIKKTGTPERPFWEVAADAILVL